MRTAAAGGTPSSRSCPPAAVARSSRTNDGLSAATAKQTIGAAVTAAGTDDIINIAAGTYAETVTVNKPLTITGAGPTQTIIDPPATANGINVSASDVIIEDLQITGALQAARLMNVAISNITFDTVHFLNNTDINSRGIEIQTAANTDPIKNVVVRNSLFDNTRVGIRISSATRVEEITIEGSSFLNNPGSGFYQANDFGVGWVKKLTITDSTFTNNGTAATHAGVYAEEFSDVLIEDSNFSTNKFGINLWDAKDVAESVTNNVVIRDNQFTNHPGSSISVQASTSNPSIQFVQVEGNTINEDVSVLGTSVYSHIAITTHATEPNGKVNVIDNTITFSGTYQAASAATFGIYIAGRAQDAHIGNNTLEGGNVGTKGGYPIPTSGIRIASANSKADTNILVTKNTIKQFDNGVLVISGITPGGLATGATVNITRNDLSSNSAYGIRSGATTVAGGACNWWGDTSGPSGEGPGAGTQVSTHVQYAVWLNSNDLDGHCSLITVRKVAPDDSTVAFEFDPSWSTDNFTLTDGHFFVFGPLPAGDYSVGEVNLPAKWWVDSATCDNLATPETVETADPAYLVLTDGDDWDCTFTNVYIPTGSITVIKETNPDGEKGFTFTLEPDTHPYVAKWGSQGTTGGQFGRAMGIAVDADGNVYVADDYNHRIQKFDANGNFLLEWGGSPGGSSDPGKLKWPLDVAVDSLGNVYVADYGNSRIQKFDADGNYVDQWGGEGSVDGQLYYPHGLAVDSAGNVYVADTYNFRVQKFDGNGNHLLTFGNYGVLGGEFSVPYGIEVDSAGNIYVSDTYNHRMQKFDATGAFLLAWGWDVVAGNGDTDFEFCTVAADCQQGAVGSGQGQFNYNGQVAVDEYGNVFVTDTNSRIQKFASDGTYMLSWGRYGSANGQFAYPYGVAVDGSNYVYVTDTYNYRVQKFNQSIIVLDDDQSYTFNELIAGDYSLTETDLPTDWSLQSATCDNRVTQTVETVNPANITLIDYDDWVCLFTNAYTPPPTNVCAAGTFSNERTTILGIGMGSPKKHKNVAKITVPNWANLTALYGQMVAVDSGQAKYVRFIMPGKKNWTEVSTITSSSDHVAGNFWYGADIDPALMPAKNISNGKTTINGRWFLQKTGTKNHIPRALVLYPTYADQTNNYVNVFQTFGAGEGEVYWDTASGWTQTREIRVPIAPPQADTTFHVELALADNDKDNRPVWITVTAGNVTQTVTPTNPDKGEQLNILTFDLPNVPIGTNVITIEVYSPSMAADGIIGDSAALVGMTANYACAPLN